MLLAVVIDSDSLVLGHEGGREARPPGSADRLGRQFPRRVAAAVAAVIERELLEGVEGLGTILQGIDVEEQIIGLRVEKLVDEALRAQMLRAQQAV